MSLYNQLFGANPAAMLLLASVGIKPQDVARLRDVWLEEEPAHASRLRVAVYTRMGGGNRECWHTYSPEDQTCDGTCPACLMDTLRRDNPAYLFGTDDDFDSTYRTDYFRVPDHLVPTLRMFVTEEPSPKDKWAKLFEALAGGDMGDPVVKRATEVVAPIMQELRDTLDKEANDGTDE